MKTDCGVGIISPNAVRGVKVYDVKERMSISNFGVVKLFYKRRAGARWGKPRMSRVNIKAPLDILILSKKKNPNNEREMWVRIS